MFAVKESQIPDLSPEQMAMMRLARTPRVGPVTLRRLLARFQTPQDALSALPHLSKKGGKALDPVSTEQIQREEKALRKLGGSYVLWGDESYPESLYVVEDSPPILSILGDPAILAKPQVAIVGARNASLNARKFTHQLAADLVKAGFVITSGMARGIDTAAHEGALAAGGQTVAVLAGGVDVIYPRENAKLYEQIKKRGCIVGENPIATQPSAQLFPRRNRIVSGLSRAVVVVEASERSGSLITARMALEQGREVLAVPGYPGDPRASGPNKLIREGALLIRHAEDVMEALSGWQLPQPEQSQLLEEEELFAALPDDKEANDIQEYSTQSDAQNLNQEILELLSGEPLAIDELIRACHVSVSELNTALLAMELAGEIERLPGNRVCRLSQA